MILVVLLPSAICFGSMLLGWCQAVARLFLVEPSHHPHLILAVKERDTWFHGPLSS